MNNFTFLTKEQLEGCHVMPEGIIMRGEKAAITDFSILLGGWFDSSSHINSDVSLTGRIGCYWTKTKSYSPLKTENVYISNGMKTDSANVNRRLIGARPALKFSSIDKIPTNGTPYKRAKDGVLEVEYGFYPQSVVSVEMEEELNIQFNNGRLEKTCNAYTTDSRKVDDKDKKFEAQRHEEYKYKGKKYIRVKANTDFYGSAIQLSNGEMYKDGDYVWIEVEPIKWWVSEKYQLMFTEKIVFAGVQFKHIEPNDISEHKGFEDTDIKKFMDEYWSKDIEQLRTKKKFPGYDKTELELGKKQPVSTRRTRLQKLNPDYLQDVPKKKMTITEELKSYIEAGESVLLRGPSGIGKTDRVKTLYPDLVYIKLTNNMFPEKVVGSTNLQTGESIPPDFAKQIILEGATGEERELVEKNIQNIYDVANKVYERSKTSDKKVVILLDELLNVKPAVQSLVYTLI